MSVLATHLTSGFDTSNGQTATTASVAPAGPVLMGVASFDVGTPTAIPTVTGLGLTWTQCGSARSFGNYQITVWLGTGTPSSGTVGIDFGTGNTMSNIAWSLIELGNVPASPFVRAAGNQAASGATSLTVTLGVAPAASNATFGFIVRPLQENIVAGSGYTELGESQANNPDMTIESEWRSDAQQTIDWSWTTASGVAGIGVEIAVAGTTGTAAVSEVGDSASAAGKLGYSGTAAVSEVGDSASAVGSTGSTSRTGTVAISEVGDSAVAVGQLKVSGTATVSEVGDSAHGDGVSAGSAARDITILHSDPPYVGWSFAKPAKSHPLTTTEPAISYAFGEPESEWEFSAPTT